MSSPRPESRQHFKFLTPIPPFTYSHFAPAAMPSHAFACAILKVGQASACQSEHSSDVLPAPSGLNFARFLKINHLFSVKPVRKRAKFCQIGRASCRERV